MPKKIIRTDGHGNAVNNPEIKYKKKATPYKEPDWITEYKLKRDRVIWQSADEETKLELREKYGF